MPPVISYSHLLLSASAVIHSSLIINISTLISIKFSLLLQHVHHRARLHLFLLLCCAFINLQFPRKAENCWNSKIKCVHICILIEIYSVRDEASIYVDLCHGMTKCKDDRLFSCFLTSVSFRWRGGKELRRNFIIHLFILNSLFGGC